MRLLQTKKIVNTLKLLGARHKAAEIIHTTDSRLISLLCCCSLLQRRFLPLWPWLVTSQRPSQADKAVAVSGWRVLCCNPPPSQVNPPPPVCLPARPPVRPSVCLSALLPSCFHALSPPPPSASSHRARQPCRLHSLPRSGEKKKK